MVKYHNDYTAGEFDHPLQPGMMICVEAYIGAVGGRDGIKLEEQILLTGTGYERLSSFPYDERLLSVGDSIFKELAVSPAMLQQQIAVGLRSALR